jgi:hypothetical protein
LFEGATTAVVRAGGRSSRRVTRPDFWNPWWGGRCGERVNTEARLQMANK